MSDKHEHGARTRWLGPGLIALGWLAAALPDAVAAEAPGLERAAAEYASTARPLLAKYCLECHSAEVMEGDLDLERFATLGDVRQASGVWLKVAEMLDSGAMPPKDGRRLPADKRRALRDWLARYLKAEAQAGAGDPGPVVLRRLSNAQYTYTLRDLTGVPLDPAREFPVDGAAGEGFTNNGSALVMSPSLLAKYYDAAKAVAAHAVPLPDGLRFSPGTTRRDWTNEVLEKIRAFYAEFTDAGGGMQQVNLQGIVFGTNAGGRLPLERYLAATLAERDALTVGSKTIAAVARERSLSPKYLGLLWESLNGSGTEPEMSPLLDLVRARWKAAGPADAPAIAAEVARWQSSLWKFNRVGHIGKVGGPRSWIEPVAPFLSGQAARLPVPDAATFDGFRRLFPPALCYTKIVPVDEVVTLTLFHREDGPLRRLMLDDAQAAQLDRLWGELRFVSQDALTLVDAFQQLLEYASQDGDPSQFEPLRRPIQARADAFRRALVAAEPRQVDAVLGFAARAYRRPLKGSEAAGLRALYHQLRREGLPHDDAWRLLLARVLVSPSFLYRVETAGPGASAVPLNDWELASRLSYFLWSSVPDETLRELAASGRLRDPEVLAAQARRMLKDDKVRRLASEFACQWLQVYDFDTLDEKSARHFPTFAGLRGALYEETIRFFTDLYQRDLPALAFLDADHTLLNEPLAHHYGIPGVAGEDWRRVEGVKAFGRGGILGLGATLARQSGASRTSPILRGNWVSEVLLGEKLPKPPPGVPQLPDDEATAGGLSVRQLIERHTRDASCATCHVKIDPLGFALEGYDAIGRRRDRDLGDHPVSVDAKLQDGTTFAGLDGLRDYLLTKRREAVARQFGRKLLGYALGRGVQLSDDPLLDDLTRIVARDGRFSAAVEAIVRSPQFRTIRGRDHAIAAIP